MDRSRACIGKQAYLSKPQAKRVARSMSRRHRAGFHLYACPWCNLYHVGHEGERWRGVPAEVRAREAGAWAAVTLQVQHEPERGVDRVEHGRAGPADPATECCR